MIYLENNYKIYVHVNKINGKLYIGQTCQKNINNRWRKGKGYKDNPLFWNALEKYGWDNFEHIVLFENLSLDMTNIIEEELIKKYNTTNDKFGYNINFGGGNKRLSESTKNKLSKLAKVRMNSYTKEKLKEIGRKISIANSGENNGFFGKKHTDKTRKKMSENHANFKGENHPMYNRNHSEKTKKIWSEKRKGKNLYANNPNAKAVNQYDKNMNFIKTFYTIKEASESVGVQPQTIHACLRGKLKTAGGYVWKYTSEDQHE